ncbi:MAG: hypothetical protein AAF907_12030 [Planctomycetota bacterium]
MRDFYKGGRRFSTLNDAIQRLEESTASTAHRSRRMETYLRWVLLPVGLFGGWRWVNAAQIERTHTELAIFRSVMLGAVKLDLEERIELRIRLTRCWMALHCDVLFGPRARKLADRTEHFCQSDRLEFASIESLLAAEFRQSN